MNNNKIAEILNNMATLLEIKGENVFKIKAYQKAADNIRALGEDVAQLRQQNRLSEIPGIGQAIESKIGEWLDTGKISAYQELLKEIPETLLDVVKVPTIGPKKAKLFYDHLKVKSLDDLRQAAMQGKLLTVPGIKDKGVENILKGLNVVAAGQARMNLAKATIVAEKFIEALRKFPEVKKISLAGSLRRGSETVGDIDILVDAKEPKKVMEAFIKLPFVKNINAQGETKSSIITEDNVQVDLRVIDSNVFGAALLYFTGSKNFNISLRQLAIKKNMKVSEYGVFAVNGEKEKLLASKTEEDCFKVLGMPYVPPELREEIGTEDIFNGKEIPKLIELSDIKGEVHVHSTYSDGRNTIEEMAEAAIKRGYQYLAISDHSPRLKVAGGVSVADLKIKRKEIDALNKRLKNFRVLMGTEVEVDLKGDLDYNNDVLETFDVVIAAVHSGFEQSRELQTQRIIKACSNKFVNILAHPFGVHLGKREPMDFDFKEVCKVARDNNVYLEINASAVRLDLNSSHAHFALREGNSFVINSDAHTTEQMEYLKHGVTIARRGWITAKDVLNTLSLNELLKRLKKK